jgi:hypothetical protein
LKGYWKLAGDALDYSGNGNHGTWTGTEAYTLGPRGKDVSKFGGSSFIRLQPNNVLVSDINSVTLSIVATRDSLTSALYCAALVKHLVGCRFAQRTEVLLPNLLTGILQNIGMYLPLMASRGRLALST